MDASKFEHIGKVPCRVDGLPKVTGRAQFIDDFIFPGLLYAKIVRSTVAHGFIEGYDISEALTVSGVIGVITGEDCRVRYGACLTDRFPLAKDKVRFMGEPVAAVVAISAGAASWGASRVRVHYKKLPHSIDPREAAKMEACILHEEFNTYKCVPGIYPIVGTNVFHHLKIRRGDVDQVFSKAHLVVQNEYSYPLCHHGQLEPHGAVAIYEGGSLDIWSSSQAPFIVRREAAHILGLSPSKIRVMVPYVGGGFGGKSDVTIEPLLAYVASKMPGRYIKLLLTREEMFDGTVVGRGAHTRYQTAFSRDGRVMAQKVEAYLSGGGYGDCAVNIVSGIGMAAAGPYEIEHIQVDVYGVYTNAPPTGAYRGYGYPEAHLGAEQQMDIAARKLGLDPVQIRLLNGIVPGRVNAIGQVMEDHNGRLDLCIDAVAAEMGWDQSFERGCGRKIRGRGIAAYMKAPIMPTNAQSGAIIKLNEDGSVCLSVGVVEMGQGCYTSLSQIVAEALKIPLEKVSITQEVDTRYSPYEWQTVASRTTWASGNAIIKAVEQLKEKILNAASLVLNVPASELTLHGGRVTTRGGNGSVSLKELAVGSTESSGKAISTPLAAEASFVPENISYLDRETGQGNMAADWTFGCTGVELEVDRVSGDIEITRVINAIDAGTIINPQLAEGQIVGAVVQALGGTLSETLVFSADGEIRNKNLVDYKIPELPDIPDITSIFIETPEKTGPFGARGLGEHATIGVAPAIANALRDAVELDFFSLPITPAKVVERLTERRP